MMRFVALFLAFALAALPAAAQSFNAQQQAEMRAIMRDYLVNNPDVLQDALEALAARKHVERIRRAQNDPRDFSVGPANAPITVVEFFDYRCPICVRALPWMMRAVQTQRDVRFVFKEMPIAELHGQPAIEASRASIAAIPQGHYLQFHQRLLSFPGDLTSARIDQIARQSGIDVVRMRRAMNTANVTKLLNDNQSLAVDLSEGPGVATPTFVVNGRVRVGWSTDEDMDQFLREARAAHTAMR